MKSRQGRPVAAHDRRIERLARLLAALVQEREGDESRRDMRERLAGLLCTPPLPKADANRISETLDAPVPGISHMGVALSLQEIQELLSYAPGTISGRDRRVGSSPARRSDLILPRRR